ncbi:MAG: PDZ domain-containing protein [Lachnospiraceae bacterium]|nr:PDZ domain-containing protein [Lachnospiraceae bacterium]
MSKSVFSATQTKSGENMDEKDLQMTDNTEVKEKMLSFMHETTREKPLNKRKLVRRTVITAFSALIFGVVACFTFLVLEPVISNWLYPEEITKIKFPEEEKETLPEEMLTEDALQQEIYDDIVQQVEEITSQGSSQNLTTDSYEQIYKSLNDVATEAGKFMVTVKGTVSETDLLQDIIEKENMTSGVVIADNGVEYLILADLEGLSDSETYSVTFQSGVQAEAVLKGRHTPTGLGIFAVRYADFTENDRARIQIAVLGNSNAGVSLGQPIIAVGKPIGESGSLLYGMISSKGGILSLPDATYQMIDTDMQDSPNAAGALVNLRKEVIGFITESARKGKSHAYISAIGISDLKQLVEKLSNGEGIAYTGIRGMDVTTKAHDELGVPYGAYVSEVAMHSPAMEAGILAGDIVVQIDAHEVASFSDYRKTLLSKVPGDTVIMHIRRFTGEEYAEMEINLALAECE